MKYHTLVSKIWRHNFENVRSDQIVSFSVRTLVPKVILALIIAGFRLGREIFIVDDDGQHQVIPYEGVDIVRSVSQIDREIKKGLLFREYPRWYLDEVLSMINDTTKQLIFKPW